MSLRLRAAVAVMIILSLCAGCVKGEPTATPVPATATRIVLEATNTPFPPTATPAPPTVTAVPPTPTDTPLPPSDTPPPAPTAKLVPPTAAPTATPTPAPLLLLESIPQAFEYTETPQVGLGDLDGDGDLDAVFANMGVIASQVWLNDGTGQFTDSGQRLTQQGHGVGLGDLDGDGDLDIFMTCASYDPGDGWRDKPSRIYLNDGRGTFHDSGQDIGDTELSGTGLKLIDLDGDRDLDAHIIYYEVGGMADRVYLNDGTGRFSDSGLALEEDVIAWGDLDGDGDLDILTKVLGEGYRVLLNDGMGRFAAGWDLENSQAMRGDIALADFDGDGDLDALVANGTSSEGSYPTHLLRNDGRGQFTDTGQELNETSAAKFAVGDLDQDGSLDVFVSNVDRPNEIWLNDGRGQLTDSGLRLEESSSKLTTRPSLGDLDGDGRLDVIVAGFQGKVEVWLNRTPLPAAEGVGGVIAFSSDRNGNDEICVLAVPDGTDVDGSDPRNLTHHPASDTAPAWSPDGSQIAFSSDRSGNYDIYVMDADGANPQQLTQHPAVDAQPTWSPDGTQIAFVSLRDGNAEIYVIAVPDGTDADSSNLQRLTRTQADEFEFDWSPDGTQFVFASAEGDYANIYLMNSDGGARQQLTHTDAHDLYPRWSPDGTQIAFLSRRDGGLEEIYLMDSDGSNQRRLTTNDAFDGAPSWSPDGTQFVFASDRDGNHEIYVMDADDAQQGSGNVRRLTDNSAADRKPAWRPSLAEATIQVPTTVPTDQPSGLPDLEQITVENADQVELLATLRIPNYTLDQSWHGQCGVAFSPDGSLLIGTCEKNSLPVWDIPSLELRHRLFAVSEHTISCDFGPDGQMVACGRFDYDWSIPVWNPVTGEHLMDVGNHQSSVWDVDFGPDGRLLASCSLDRRGDVRLWRVSPPERLWSHKLNYVQCLSVSFHPSGDSIAASAIHGQVEILDVQTGELILMLEDATRHIGDLAFSPSGDWLAAGSDDSRIFLWDTTDYHLVTKMSGHRSYVNGVVFSADETYLVSGSDDETLAIWSLDGFQMLTQMTGHEDTVLRVDLNTDNTLIASVSWDGTVRLWGVVEG